MKNFVVGMFLFAIQALQPSVSVGNNELNSNSEPIVYTEEVGVETKFQSVSVTEMQWSAEEEATKTLPNPPII